MISSVRIGTWNLDARASRDHRRVLDDLDCDVWLLTEVPPEMADDEGIVSASPARMGRGQSFACVLSRNGGGRLDAPYPACAAMNHAGVSYYSCVLPWRTCAPDWTWCEGSQAMRTVDAVSALERGLVGEVVVGGDWNQAMSGPNYGGTALGRTALNRFLNDSRLQLPTRRLRHPKPGMATIDHIALPQAWPVLSAECHEVPRRLSDHDVYVVEVRAPGHP